MIKILFVAGARPNFPKIAPLLKECLKLDLFDVKLVHTGQHFDYVMSDSFFKDLEIPEPDKNFLIGGGSHAENTGKTMIEFEKYVLEEKPALIVVVGDVNATLACGIVAKKCGIKLAHVEAGLRSFDENMPEEINRVLVDRISDYLFVSEESGIRNLLKEGIDQKKIFFIGNVMIDSLIRSLPTLDKTLQTTLGIYDPYFLITIHRPALVDNKKKLESFLDFLMSVNQTTNLVWPIHPRTKKNAEAFGLTEKISKIKNLKLLSPLPYKQFLSLTIFAQAILTDSGGIQEETSYLNIPCLTFRENTERPSTIECGTNTLVGFDYILAKEKIDEIKNNKYKQRLELKFWDGHAAKRFAEIIKKELS